MPLKEIFNILQLMNKINITIHDDFFEGELFAFYISSHLSGGLLLEIQRFTILITENL